MNKVIPIVGLVVFLLVLGIWLSRPSQPSVVAQSSEPSQETSQDAPTGATQEDTAEDVAQVENSVISNEEASSELKIPEGFVATPLLSDIQIQSFEKAEQVLEENKDYQVLIKTNKGIIRGDLFEEGAPNTVNNFVFLAKNKYFDGIIFHRVIEDFMAQTGDPTGTGRGGPGYQFEDEFNAELRHNKPGIFSMANSGPNTNGSQFFITFAETPWLDDRHSVFGEVIEGQDVLDALERVDPSNPNPSVIANFDAPLSELINQGIALEADPEQSIETYLTEVLGALPELGSRFDLAGYDAIAGRVGETPAIGIFPPTDVMEQVIIIERDKPE